MTFQLLDISSRCYMLYGVLVIRSAVTPCAFPGLFEAQEHMVKDRFGEIVPYHAPFSASPQDTPGASARRWRGGDLDSDLPMIQLRAYGGNFAVKLAHLADMEAKHRCNQILELGFPLGGIPKLFTQDWEGDVTVVKPATLV